MTEPADDQAEEGELTSESDSNSSDSQGSYESSGDDSSSNSGSSSGGASSSSDMNPADATTERSDGDPIQQPATIDIDHFVPDKVCIVFVFILHTRTHTHTLMYMVSHLTTTICLASTLFAFVRIQSQHTYGNHCPHDIARVAQTAVCGSGRDGGTIDYRTTRARCVARRAR